RRYFVWNFHSLGACCAKEQPTCLRAIANFNNFKKEYRVMISIMKVRVVLLVLFCAVAVLLPAATQAQNPGQPARPAAEDTNLEIQLYLILASNREIEEGKLPAVLDPVVKQLRESLPFKHYNLAATFLNRVRNNGKLEVTWMGGPFESKGSPATSNPSFSELTAFVKLFSEDGNRDVVRLNEFRFGTRVPIITGQTASSVSTNAAVFPMVTYQPVGLHTDLSMREGSLVIAGTLNVGPSGDSLVVAVSARRAN
ncbi:MAG TPA: hypothetical protein VKD91_02335, partial [Pyrinomonadaceae bacterium]|nr:hypothetical protein [Pyrinomonadaceae bacterium]